MNVRANSLRLYGFALALLLASPLGCELEASSGGSADGSADPTTPAPPDVGRGPPGIDTMLEPSPATAQDAGDRVVTLEPRDGAVPPSRGAGRDGGRPSGNLDAGLPASRTDAAIAAVDADVVPAPHHDAGNDRDPRDERRCGTRGGRECTGGQFCKFDERAQCGALDQGGTCSDKPQVCTTIFQPVCGCDRRTYASECTANAAGVSVQHTGACTPEECSQAGGRVLSTGAANPMCKKGELQWSVAGSFEPAVCCLKPDKPEKSEGKLCGGLAGLGCDGDASFCNYELAAGGQGCENIADGAGVCQPMPSACTFEYAPVCGCDRKTYGTRCAANALGVSVMRAGECNELDCQAIGGRPVDGLGPAPVCARGETNAGPIRYAGGQIAIEGTICCVP